MGKRLVDIKKDVDNSRLLFLEYLKSNLDDDIWGLLCDLSQYTDVYIFSGIIRNFFLKKTEFRDLDLIINKTIDVEKILKLLNIKFRLNSFGGYKLNINNINIDLWYLEDTWALKQQGTIDFELYKYIPSTAFFNFSAIIYSLREKQFYCKNHFLSFLRERKINYVYKPNANYALCIINSFYYSEKYNLKLAVKLKSYLTQLHRKKLDYAEIQLKHFGEILYSDEDISNKIKDLNK